MGNKNLIIIAVSPTGNGLSGGDRIFIELARNASLEKIPTTVVTWKAGINMCEKTLLTPSVNLHFIDLHLDFLENATFVVSYIQRVLKSALWAFSYSFPKKDWSSVVIYSASDFWMDVVPALILKFRFPHITWAGTFYLAAPNPLTGYKEGGSWKVPTLKAVMYWLMQLPIYYLTRSFAQFVFITSEPDRKRFPRQAKKGNVVVIKGGVDLAIVEKYKKKIGKVEKAYDAVFMGRFHPQKGVLELIDIWKSVVTKLPKAKLVMIGDGPLMSKVREKIEQLDLEENVTLTGYLLDGLEKYTIFAKSKIVVHPAIYDSGGMSAAEAMAWGLPGVSFDLMALKTYYPKGMLKVPLHNNQRFALMVVDLLTKNDLYLSEKKKALDLIRHYWDWTKRAKESLAIVFS